MKQYITTLLLSLAAVFAPVEHVMIVTLAMIAMDLITGLLAARKQAIPISSSGLRRTITKMFVYEIVIAMGFLVETYMTGAAIPVVKIITSFIGLTELKSCMENLDIINGSSILKTIIEKLGSQNQ
jgi:hypothetical protein